MNFKISTTTAALFLSAINPAFADSHKSEGRLTAELTFESIDRHSNGYIHQGDLESSAQTCSRPWILMTTCA